MGYTYDINKQLTSILSPSGTPYNFTYDGFGRSRTVKIGTCLLSEYVYDVWGKVLSISDGNGNDITGNAGHVANINPLRYRGYYYDAATGFYYVSSRYYDPEVGRFISPDTTDILGADSDLYDKNLYAYCDNNPVMRKDSSGELWIAAVAVGVATQYAGDVLGNLIAGKSGMDLFTPTSSIGEYVAAGVTALIPGSGIGGSLIRNITSEAIISVERYVTGKSNNLPQKANTMRQKNSNVSTNTIRTSAQRSVRWGNRLAKGIEFVFNSIRSALPW